MKLIAGSALLLTSAPASRADVLNPSLAGVAAGHAVMLDLRMPLGAPQTSAFEPKLRLAYGSSWRAAPGTAQEGAQLFAPHVEASLTLGDKPAMQFGSLDAMKGLARRMNAEGEPSSANGSIALYVLGGLLIVGAGVAAAAVIDDAVDTYEFLDEHIDDPQGP